MFSKLFKNLYDGEEESSQLLDSTSQSKNGDLSSRSSTSAHDDELFLMALAKSIPLPDVSPTKDSADEALFEKETIRDKGSKKNKVKILNNQPNASKLSGPSSPVPKSSKLSSHDIEIDDKRSGSINKIQIDGHTSHGIPRSPMRKNQLTTSSANTHSKEIVLESINKSLPTELQSINFKKKPSSPSLNNFSQKNSNSNPSTPFSAEINSQKNNIKPADVPQRRLSLQEAQKPLPSLSPDNYADTPSTNRRSSFLLGNLANWTRNALTWDSSSKDNPSGDSDNSESDEESVDSKRESPLPPLLQNLSAQEKSKIYGLMDEDTQRVGSQNIIDKNSKSFFSSKSDFQKSPHLQINLPVKASDISTVSSPKHPSPSVSITSSINENLGSRNNNSSSQDHFKGSPPPSSSSKSPENASSEVGLFEAVKGIFKSDSRANQSNSPSTPPLPPKRGSFSMKPVPHSPEFMNASSNSEIGLLKRKNSAPNIASTNANLQDNSNETRPINSNLSSLLQRRKSAAAPKPLNLPPQNNSNHTHFKSASPKNESMRSLSPEIIPPILSSSSEGSVFDAHRSFSAPKPPPSAVKTGKVIIEAVTSDKLEQNTKNHTSKDGLITSIKTFFWGDQANEELKYNESALSSSEVLNSSNSSDSIFSTATITKNSMKPQSSTSLKTNLPPIPPAKYDSTAENKSWNPVPTTPPTLQVPHKKHTNPLSVNTLAPSDSTSKLHSNAVVTDMKNRDAPISSGSDTSSTLQRKPFGLKPNSGETSLPKELPKLISPSISTSKSKSLSFEEPLTPGRRKSISESFFGKRKNSFQIKSPEIKPEWKQSHKSDADSDASIKIEEVSIDSSQSLHSADSEPSGPIPPASNTEFRRNSAWMDLSRNNHENPLPGGWGSPERSYSSNFSESHNKKNTSLPPNSRMHSKIANPESNPVNRSLPHKEHRTNSGDIPENYVQEIVNEFESVKNSNTDEIGEETKPQATLSMATSFLGGLFSRKANGNEAKSTKPNASTPFHYQKSSSPLPSPLSPFPQSQAQTGISKRYVNSSKQKDPPSSPLPGGFSFSEREINNSKNDSVPFSPITIANSSSLNATSHSRGNEKKNTNLSPKVQNDTNLGSNSKPAEKNLTKPEFLWYTDASENESWSSDSEQSSERSSLPPTPSHDPSAPSIFGRLFFGNYSSNQTSNVNSHSVPPSREKTATSNLNHPTSRPGISTSNLQKPKNQSLEPFLQKDNYQIASNPSHKAQHVQEFSVTSQPISTFSKTNKKDFNATSSSSKNFKSDGSSEKHPSEYISQEIPVRAKQSNAFGPASYSTQPLPDSNSAPLLEERSNSAYSNLNTPGDKQLGKDTNFGFSQITKNIPFNPGMSVASSSIGMPVSPHSVDTGLFGRITSWLSQASESPILEANSDSIRVEVISQLDSPHSVPTISLETEASECETPYLTSINDFPPISNRISMRSSSSFGFTPKVNENSNFYSDFKAKETIDPNLALYSRDSKSPASHEVRPSLNGFPGVSEMQLPPLNINPRKNAESPKSPIFKALLRPLENKFPPTRLSNQKEQPLLNSNIISNPKSYSEVPAFFQGTNSLPHSSLLSSKKDQSQINDIEYNSSDSSVTKIQKPQGVVGGHGFDEFVYMDNNKPSQNALEASLVRNLISNTENGSQISKASLEPNPIIFKDDLNPFFFSNFNRTPCRPTSRVEDDPLFYQVITPEPASTSHRVSLPIKSSPNYVLFDLEQPTAVAQKIVPVVSDSNIQSFNSTTMMESKKMSVVLQETKKSEEVAPFFVLGPEVSTTGSQNTKSATPSGNEAIQHIPNDAYHSNKKFSAPFTSDKFVPSRSPSLKPSGPSLHVNSKMPSKEHAIDLLDLSLPDVSFLDLYSFFDKNPSPEKERKKIVSSAYVQKPDHFPKNSVTSSNVAHTKTLGPVSYPQNYDLQTKEKVALSSIESIPSRIHLFKNLHQASAPISNKAAFNSQESFNSDGKRQSISSLSLYSKETGDEVHPQFNTKKLSHSGKTPDFTTSSAMHTSNVSNFSSNFSKITHPDSTTLESDPQYFNGFQRKNYQMFSIPFFSKSNASADLNLESRQKLVDSGIQIDGKLNVSNKYAGGKRYSIICTGDKFMNRLGGDTSLDSDLTPNATSLSDFQKKHKLPEARKRYAIYGGNQFLIPLEVQKTQGTSTLSPVSFIPIHDTQPKLSLYGEESKTQSSNVSNSTQVPHFSKSNSFAPSSELQSTKSINELPQAQAVDAPTSSHTVHATISSPQTSTHKSRLSLSLKEAPLLISTDASALSKTANTPSPTLSRPASESLSSPLVKETILKRLSEISILPSESSMKSSQHTSSMSTVQHSDATNSLNSHPNLESSKRNAEALTSIQREASTIYITSNKVYNVPNPEAQALITSPFVKASSPSFSLNTIENNGSLPLQRRRMSAVREPDTESLIPFEPLNLDISDTEYTSPSQRSIHLESLPATPKPKPQFHSIRFTSPLAQPITRPITPSSEEFSDKESETSSIEALSLHQSQFENKFPLFSLPTAQKNIKDSNTACIEILNAAMSFRSALESLVVAGEYLASILEDVDNLHGSHQKGIAPGFQGNLLFLVELLRLLSSSNDQLSKLVLKELEYSLRLFASENDIPLNQSSSRPHEVSQPANSKKKQISDSGLLFYPALLRSTEGFSAGAFACFYNLGSSFRILAEMVGDKATVSAEAALLFRQLSKLKHAPPFSVLSTNHLYGVAKMTRYSLGKKLKIFNKHNPNTLG